MADTSTRRSGRLTTTPIATEAKDGKKKNYIQTNIKPLTKNVNEKPVTNSRLSRGSSDESPVGAPDDTGNSRLNSICDSLEEIKKTMVSKSDIGEMVKNILLELKTDFVKEIKAAIKDEIKEDLKNELKCEIEKSAERSLEEKIKRVSSVNSEHFDAVNMDLTDIREKIAGEKRELQKLTEELRQVARNARQAISMANFNQQYSQKCNIKILGWREQNRENLKENFCSILKEKVNIDVNPADILAIHRIPGNGGTRPVIVRMISSDAKTNIMKHRKSVKEFTMVDHITQQNAQLIQRLKEHPSVHSAWYFNSKVFAIDKDNHRRTFDILDDINKKLRQ